MKGIFLLLGSNMGDRLAVLRRASGMISNEIGRVAQRSSIYVSEAWGKRDQPDFLNQVLEVESMLEPLALLDKVLLIEKRMGRQRKLKWSERIIDIDILYYGDQIVNSRRLTIPHPYISSRRFTLEPLCEMAPALIHPVLKLNQAALLAECEDKLKVAKLADDGTEPTDD